MYKISEFICLGFLAAATAKDIKTRKISVLLLMLAGAACLGYRIFARSMDWKQMAGGAAVGGIFLLLSKWTREGIGYGDSIGITILGAFLGFFRVLTVLSVTFFLLLCVSIPMLWRNGMWRKYGLAFYPFLTLGYICLLLAERMNG